MDNKTRWALSRIELPPTHRIALAYIAELVKTKRDVISRTVIIKTIPVSEQSLYSRILDNLVSKGYLQIATRAVTEKGYRNRVSYTVNIGTMSPKEQTNPYYLKNNR